MITPNIWVPLELDLGPLAPAHLSEILMGIVLVGLVWLVLAKKVVPAYEKMYAERADAITGGIERAEAAQAKAQEALAEYKAQLAGAREEAASIREDAKNTGAQIIAEMREQATAESNRIIEQSERHINASRQQAMEQLRREVGGLATTLATKIVGESLQDDQRSKATVDRFISELESETESLGQDSWQ